MIKDFNLAWVILLLVFSARGETKDIWSLQPVKRPEVPNTDASLTKIRNPIDAFVQRKLLSKNLKPSPKADRFTLLRRLSLDLTGLPPSPGRMEAFVNDPRSTNSAYRELVDELLNSPRFGERWAQHWLDIIRWAETAGFETNVERTDAWYYRDWVIKALNDDMPYDRFILHQIAGDVTGEDAALGFLVSGPANLPGQIGRDEEAMRSARQDELDEVIRTVSQSFLGLTIGCARCHDHKFDPILQNDYYGMQAIFAGLRYGKRRLQGEENDEWTTRVPKAQQEYDDLLRQLEAMRKQYNLRKPLGTVHSEFLEQPIDALAVKMYIHATSDGRSASLYEFETWTKEKRNVALASNGAKPSGSSYSLANRSRHFDNLIDGSVDKRQAEPWIAKQAGPAWIRVDFPKAVTIERIVWHSGFSMPADFEIEVLSPGIDLKENWRRVIHADDRLPRLADTRSATKVKLEGLKPEQINSLVALNGSARKRFVELNRLSSGPQVYAASFAERPETTWLLRRGDPMQRMKESVPAIPPVLGKMELKPNASEPDRRLALAKHLIHKDHPLTARVLINRIWQNHFGMGLVDTPSDFGHMGRKPTHPQLLDWLANEFVQNGWSMKKLHRLIVNSHTYLQTSKPREEALRVDADSRLLWRFPPRRLEAEAIRDCILSISGKLNQKTGGRGFDFFDQRGGLSDYHPKETFEKDGWRRMIYAHKVRMQSVDIFGAFDCPDAGQMKPRRTRSITPLQSLSLLNSPFAIRQAGFFADRVRKEKGEAIKTQVDHAFRLACSRSPRPGEKEVLEKLAKEHGLEQVCRVLFNSSTFMYLQ